MTIDKEAFRNWRERIRAIMNREWDPIGGCPEDEYDRYVRTMSAMIQDNRVPIYLKVSDYDDTEMIQAARNALHRMFVELSYQTLHWKLSAKELRLLSDMSSRPRK